MKWLRELFSFGKRPGSYAPAPRNAIPPPSQEAARITGESINSYLARLDRAAKLSGNARLAQQADRIRARLGVAK